MFNYYAFGLSISSEIELPGILGTTGNDKPNVKILLKKVDPLISGAEQQFSSNYQWDHENVYIQWENIGKVKISSGNKITVDTENNGNNLIIPFLLGPVMTILLHQRGFLVLHGSSVKMNDGAIAFLGHRGIGKSTTAINLYKKGYPIVTDDIMAINFDEDIPFIHPGYHHLRLSEDSYDYVTDNTNILTPIRTIAGKLFCDASRGFSPEPLKLKKIYLLEKGVQTNISTLNPQKILIDLISHSTAKWIFNDSDQVNNFSQCANLINNISLHRLEFTHSFKNISEIITLIEKDLLTS